MMYRIRQLARRTATIAAVAAALVAPGLISGVQAAEKIKVGVMAGEGEEIMEVVKTVAARDGLDIDIITFTDYVQPNAALDAGDIDANAFQHQPYLDNQVKTRGYHIVPIGKTIVAPIGLYSTKVKSVAQLPDGAKVGIPNDPSNGGRGLLLLAAQKLISLKPGVGITPSVADIVDNPKKLDIVELDAAQLARALGDVDAAVINTNYALEAGLKLQSDTIAIEAKENNPYGNIIAVREQDKDKPVFKKLVHAYNSPEVATFLQTRYQGALLPVW